jgi:hypothetical protein
MFMKRKFHLVEVFSKEPINGIQARVPFRWSWKEDWKISMFLMPFSQSDKSVKTPPNRTSQQLIIDLSKQYFLMHLNWLNEETKAQAIDYFDIIFCIRK